MADLEKKAEKFEENLENIEKITTPSDTEKNSIINTTDPSTKINGIKKEGYIHDITLKLISNNVNFQDVDLSSYVRTISIRKEYENLFKPIYKIIMHLPLEMINNIENMKDYKYKIVIKSRMPELYDIDQNMLPYKSTLNKEEVLNTYLIPYKLPDNIVKNGALDKIKINDPSTKVPIYRYEVELFDYRHIKTGYNLLSFSYRDAQLKYIIIDILNQYKKAGSFSEIDKLVYCEPDNIEIYDSIYLPPLCFSLAIKNLQKQFNIYSKQPIVCVEDDTLYIIKRGYSPNIKSNDKTNIVVCVGERSEMTDNFFSNVSKNIDSNTPLYISEAVLGLIDNSAIVANKYPDKVIIKSDTTTEGLQSQCLGIKDNAELLKSIKYNKDSQIINTTYSGKKHFIKKENLGNQDLQLMIDSAQADSYNIDIAIKNALFSHFKPITNINLKFSKENLQNYDGQYYAKSVIFQYDSDNNNNISNTLYIRLGRKFDDNGLLLK